MAGFGTYELSLPNLQHAGIDIDCPEHSTIKAIDDGKIVGFQLIDQSNSVIIVFRLNNGDDVEYGHVQQLSTTNYYTISSNTLTLNVTLPRWAKSLTKACVWEDLALDSYSMYF